MLFSKHVVEKRLNETKNQLHVKNRYVLCKLSHSLLEHGLGFEDFYYPDYVDMLSNKLGIFSEIRIFILSSNDILIGNK